MKRRTFLKVAATAAVAIALPAWRPRRPKPKAKLVRTFARIPIDEKVLQAVTPSRYAYESLMRLYWNLQTGSPA